jgi:CheY-like chemotaxis protein
MDPQVSSAFLLDPQWLTVALSRAERKMVLVAPAAHLHRALVGRRACRPARDRMGQCEFYGHNVTCTGIVITVRELSQQEFLRVGARASGGGRHVVGHVPASRKARSGGKPQLRRCAGESAHRPIAEDGAQAVAVAREQVPDVIILDSLMSVMDGLRACRQGRSAHRPPILDR